MFSIKNFLSSKIGNAIIAVIIITTIIAASYLPFLGIQGWIGILERHHLGGIIKIDDIGSNVAKAIYIHLMLLSAYIVTVVLEMILTFLKKRNITNLSLTSQKVVSFILLVFFSSLLTKVVILNLFQKVHCSSILLLVAFFTYYSFLFSFKDTYRKQEAFV
ncbi:hypothetical protein O0Q50_22980 [Priestia aryabhattai]|uniref:Uncharacterized protein n=1 Tax=Priestia aryabhattai TaxID=412384 RepID=A0AAX6NEG7_PRIAR|nr:hypothetical protein [Priestia aryabhattai]MDU9694050.1 hypothetical protein [Priestia aryabhattai]